MPQHAKSLRRVHASVLAASVMLLSWAAAGRLALAQTTGMLAGTVYDQSGAAIPKAAVQLKNEASGDVRDTRSNAQGYFTIPAVQPGLYTVTISAKGFGSWQKSSISFAQGDNRTLSDVHLTVGSVSEAVVVSSGNESVVPTDTGEVSTTLNAQMVSELSVLGRDAGEFIKFMPGMGLNSGLNQGSSFTDEVVGTNTGPVGQYSANGTQPNGAMAYLFDGANLLDSNMGTQVANINQDMTAEVKVMSSAYGAEFPKGPVVFEAFSKSGGSAFHGEAYLYTRNSVLNANSAYLKAQGISRPDSSYYYMGGNIGGPVVLPHFDRLQKKLFFWFGYEYMKQSPPGTLHEYFVPTDSMRAGDFSAASLAQLPGNVPAGDKTVPCPPPPAGKTSSCNAHMVIPNGDISGMMDPNAVAILKLYPHANIDPATHGGNNYAFLDNPPQNRWESNLKLDYSLSDNTKFSGSYIRQDETDLHNFTVWYAPSSSLPFPSPIIAPTTSNVGTINITHVFSPSLTNEALGSYVRYANVNRPSNPSGVLRSTIGYTAGSLFNGNSPQIPNITSSKGAVGGFYAPSFNGPLGGGGFGKILRQWTFADNVTKVLGTHTLKAGFYFEHTANEQSSGGGNIFYQGLYTFDVSGSTGTGNPIADLLLGHATKYNQANGDSVDDSRANDYSFYGQDSWKLGRKLTINYGLRADHQGQWFSPIAGLEVFDPSSYDNGSSAAPNTGLKWHAIDSSIPLSGFVSHFYFSPRASIAYDVFGKGKTVIRGGWAQYRYPFGDVAHLANEGAMGIYQYQSPLGTTSFSGISQFTPSSLNQNGTTVTALQKGDGRMPRSEDYNVTLSQALPGRSIFEVSYIGNQSQNMLIAGNLANINLVRSGAAFGPDPVTGAPGYNRDPATGVVSNPTQKVNMNDYAPYRNYQTLTVLSHGSYSNYNALQMTWSKQTGPVTFMTNYTFGKALGLRDGETANGNGNGFMVDPFVWRNNYGVLAYDHTHIFNLAYVVNLPSPIHGHHLAGGVVNGWEISGTVQWQSGAPIQPNTNGNLNAQYPQGVSSQIYLGTNAPVLMPKLLCDPRSNLKPGQYFNTSCFTLPDPGTNGPAIWPYIKGPSYSKEDIALFKRFGMGETRNLQVRLSLFNFLNHALPQFNANGTKSDIQLNFVAPGSGAASTTNTNLSTTGSPLYEVGNRIAQLAVKYNF